VKLAASTNNPPDVNGYRSPGPYSGLKDYGMIDKLQVTAAVKNDGVNWWPIVMTDVVNGLNILTPTTTPPWPLAIDAQKSAIRQKALLKFTDKRVDLSVGFAERKQTANMLVDSIDTVTDLVHDLKKRHWKAARDDFYNLWLQYRYAWTPTLLDVYGAAEAVAKADVGTYDRYRVSTRASKSVSSEEILLEDASLSQIFSVPVKRITQMQFKEEFKVRYDALLSNKTYRSLQDVGVTDPLTTAWELVPYSFVVDWFLGVGDFLDGVNALTGYTFLSGCETMYREMHLNVKFEPRTSGVWRTEAITGSAQRTVKAFNRSITGPPSSTIVLKEQPLNMTRVMDSIALLRGAFGSKAKPPARDFRKIDLTIL
jgi:hypothetical protein